MSDKLKKICINILALACAFVCGMVVYSATDNFSFEIKKSDVSGENFLAATETCNGPLTLNLKRATPLSDEIDTVNKAENAYVITATVGPEYASDKSLSWAIAWNDASSEWATDKNVEDYVSFNVTNDVTATVECLQAFGEQIVIICTANGSNANAPLSTTCTLDYLQRIKSVELVPQNFVLNEYGSLNDAVTINDEGDGNVFLFNTTTTYDPYTVSATNAAYSNTTVIFTENVRTAIADAVTALNEQYGFNVMFSYHAEYDSNDVDAVSANMALEDFFEFGAEDDIETVKPYVKNMLYQVLGNFKYENHVTFSLTVTLYYNGEYYDSTAYTELGAQINRTNLKQEVTELSLDNQSFLI
ncbi:MAG: hypothetical protein J6B04_05495 [Clostridia bacterium]|nr:hypothetical protein [Clostridia bacterium]